MIVVCDTSPVNYLVLIDEIDLLPQLFTTVVLPAGVLAELQHPRTPPRVASWARQLPPWVRVISPKGPVEDVGLGRGEAEAIAIATQVYADAVLIDERKATVVARDRGLIVQTR
jgi:predicted nucleic acid-binding protein